MLKYLVCICFFVQVLFVVNTHTSYAYISCTLAFCTSIFYCQYTHFLCMCVMYTCFFVQVFFIVNAHASYACISCTLAFLCKYFLSSIHMLLMHVFHVHLLFCASTFYRQYTCFLCMYFPYTCFFVQVFFLGSLYGQ